jgi:hypothetical protein
VKSFTAQATYVLVDLPNPHPKLKLNFDPESLHAKTEHDPYASKKNKKPTP